MITIKQQVPRIVGKRWGLRCLLIDRSVGQWSLKLVSILIIGLTYAGHMIKYASVGDCIEGNVPSLKKFMTLGTGNDESYIPSLLALSAAMRLLQRCRIMNKAASVFVGAFSFFILFTSSSNRLVRFMKQLISITCSLSDFLCSS